MKLAFCSILLLAASPLFAHGGRFLVTDHGAAGDGTTLATQGLQATIDACARSGGGTVVIPPGNFLSGALFLQPRVDLELEQGAVLQASRKLADFPVRSGERFEGHFQDHVTALLNVAHCDHFHLSGPGMIDGNGAAYWSAHTPLGRPRLCAIRDSSGVVISGVRFFNSPSWNLHLYACQAALVENCRFEIGPNAKGPSTDGTDIDSCSDVTVRGCYYAVNDDCVCLKGNRYDGLNQEPKSPPVAHIRITDCTFVRGMGALVLGTEATQIHDVELKDSRVGGKMPMLRIKFRPDTPGQDYSQIHVANIQLTGGRGMVLSVEPTHGTQVPVPAVPESRVSGILVENVSGNFESFGRLTGGSTATVSHIVLRHLALHLINPAPLVTTGVSDLQLDDVRAVGFGPSSIPSP